MHSIRAASKQLPSSATIGRAARHVKPRFQRNCMPSTRRSYASAADSAKETVKKAGGDLPWLIGAAAIAVPGTWYALQPSSKGHGDHGDHGDHKAGHHDEESEKAQEESAPAEQSEAPPKDEDNDAGEDKKESKEASSSGNKAKSDSNSDSSKDNQVKGINFKGGERKVEDDPLGKKKRIDSDLATNVGEGVSSGTGDDMSHKQRGYSNTDTRHSTDISQNSDKSKKGEGTAETAKVQGTVKPDRPQV